MDEQIEDCGGSFLLGTACGVCKRCKAAEVTTEEMENNAKAVEENSPKVTPEITKIKVVDDFGDTEREFEIFTPPTEPTE